MILILSSLSDSDDGSYIHENMNGVMDSISEFKVHDFVKMINATTRYVYVYYIYIIILLLCILYLYHYITFMYIL